MKNKTINNVTFLFLLATMFALTSCQSKVTGAPKASLKKGSGRSAAIVTAMTSTKDNGTYKAGDVIPITITFSESVTVTGVPQLTLETGATDAVVDYASGSPGTTLTFNYTVATGQSSADLDYVDTGSLALNAGTILNGRSIATTLTLLTPGSTGFLGATKAIIIDATAADTTAPTITFTSVDPLSPSPIRTPTITLTVSEATQASKLGLFSDAACSTSIATAITGIAGTNSITTTTLTDGVTTTIYAKATDAAGNASTCTSMTSYAVDRTAPYVTSVSSSPANASYKVGSVIPITVTFSHAVIVTGTPQLLLATGGGGTLVNYSSGSPGSVLTFNYTVGAGDNVLDLDYSSTGALTLNGGTIKDVIDAVAILTLATPGAANSLASNATVNVDNVAPVLSAGASSFSGANPGATLTPTIITTVTDADTSTVTLYFDASCATAKSAGATNSISASTGITLTSNANTNTTTVIYGKAVDAAGNQSSCTLLLTYTNDSVAPTISSVSSGTANGSYKTAGVMALTVTFTKSVIVTGTPQLTLETGSTDAVVNYTSGSPGTVLTFNYTVGAGQTSSLLDYVSTSSLALNSGTIKDAPGNNAILTLVTPGAATSLGANRAFAIDTTAPVITLVSIAPTSPGPSQTPVVTISVSESSGTNLLNLFSDVSCGTIAATAITGASGSNAISLTSVALASVTTIYAQATDAAGNVSTCTSLGSYTQLSTWVATTSTSVPVKRAYHTAVWSGTEMIVWGGKLAAVLNSGGRYNPVSNSWSATTTTSAPTIRQQQSAIWSGTKMIVWGGCDATCSGVDYNDGGVYDPTTDSWTATTSTGAPAVRRGQTVAWTGTKMIVWGGASAASTALDSGGQYNPTTDAWTATTSTNAPLARYFHSAVWTDTEMIIWGGNTGANSNSGGRYVPGTDTWTATTTTSAPAVRVSHSATWTGTKMVVWGGTIGGASNFNDGGQYNPTTDSWTATTTTSAPVGTSSHTAVWTGTKVIVWGGDLPNAANTGGEYNPTNDSWVATTTTGPGAGAPVERYKHTAVWTGTKMIVWGGLTNTNTGSVYTP